MPKQVASAPPTKPPLTMYNSQCKDPSCACPCNPVEEVPDGTACSFLNSNEKLDKHQAPDAPSIQTQNTVKTRREQGDRSWVTYQNMLYTRWQYCSLLACGQAPNQIPNPPLAVRDFLQPSTSVPALIPLAKPSCVLEAPIWFLKHLQFLYHYFPLP